MQENMKLGYIPEDESKGMPTFEEFREKVTEGFAERMKHLSEAEVDEYMQSEEALEEVHDAYSYSSGMYKGGKINRTIFLNGGVASCAHCLSLMY